MRGSALNVLAVLDDVGGRGLGDLTLGVPGHVGTGEAGELEGGDGGNERVADLFIAHISGAAGLFERGLDDVHTVVGVGGELVGRGAVGGDVSVDKALAGFNGGAEPL